MIDINRDEFDSKFAELSDGEKLNLYYDGIANEYINAPIIWRTHLDWEEATDGMTTWDVALAISDGDFDPNAMFFKIDEYGGFISIQEWELADEIWEYADEIYEMLCDMPKLAWDTMRLIEE